MIILKKLDLKKDITHKYKKWMNDKEVHKYSAQRLTSHTMSSIRKYVKLINNSKKE